MFIYLLLFNNFVVWVVLIFSCFYNVVGELVERFRIAFTANGKREIHVYVFLKK